eukprot:GHVT01074169.1.p1 GENE.GHVT01074169.1~~GHVT01074169.1.p1  ORF type:complete len:540 (-),score=142.53 GHVT01074169.1:898-2517(-)
MAGTVVEQLRTLHEELETCEKAGSILLAEVKRRPKNRVVYEHAVAFLLQQIASKSKQASDFYFDHDGLKKDELAFIAGQVGRGGAGGKSDVWTNFYSQIKQMKDSNRKLEAASPTNVQTAKSLQPPTPEQVANSALMNSGVDQIFSADEQLGLHVDLQENFLEFINLKKLKAHRQQTHQSAEVARLKKKKISESELGERVESFTELDYLEYLQCIDLFHLIPRYCKYRDENYKTYLINLYSYLSDFFYRQHPLARHHEIEEKFLSDFEERWRTNRGPGWEEFTHKLDLYALPTDKLFATPGTLAAHKKSPKYAKAAAELSAASAATVTARVAASEAEDATVAELEGLIMRYKEALVETFDRTVAHHQKKQSRSARELLEEAEESEGEEVEFADLEGGKSAGSDGDSDEEDDDKPVYNPLNLPLGFDGKPIPFWLYKLHGLGREYKCEICGNYSYWGPRAFERHFQEWRHAFGMRCLKIPNTVHFKEITRIEDAITLYEKLKKQAEGHTFRGEFEEECEDAHGNVMSARAYVDLKRQGLL